MRDKTGIRWLRIIIAGVLAEAVVVLLIVLAATAYKYLLSPTEADHQAFVGRAGLYTAAFGGGLATFLLALWVARRLRAGFLAHGLLVGCAAALLHVCLFAASGAGFQAAYLVADALKVAGGALGGLVARRSYEGRAAVGGPTPAA